ncbi:MAG TPA: DUF4124 domain-containing protein [Usitatibacter sp.]|jgi:glycosyltransferase involved in cell wall biosynthesis|nr:DUF4124 domain-containing protein [Usitatibacter sp.]
MMKALRALAVAMLLVPGAGSATVLYKSIGPNGVVEFSDVPPAGRSVLVEQRSVPSPTEALAASVADSASTTGLPYVIEDAGGAIARANAQVDLAEHALAEALRALGSPLQDMRLRARAALEGNAARIEFFRRNAQAARQNLIDVLRAHAAASNIASSAPAPVAAVTAPVAPLASR